MGWSFRKSTSFGPFRLSLSRSGISGSFGVKGARISMSKRGTYVTLGANGIYYRQRITSNKKPATNHTVVNPQPNPVIVPNASHTITTVDIDNVTDVDSQAFIDELESKAKKRPLFKILGLWPSVILFIYVLNITGQEVENEKLYKDVFTISKRSVFIRGLPTVESTPLLQAKKGDKFDITESDSSGWIKIRLSETSHGFVRADLGNASKEFIGYSHQAEEADRVITRQMLLALTFVALTFWCIYLYRNDKIRKTLEIYYVFDHNIEVLHQKFLQFFREFASSKKVWQNLHEEGVSDRKYFAGASKLISRTAVKGIYTHKLPSSSLKTNISVPCLILRNTELYFFPERVILKRGDTFGAAVYKNIEITSTDVKFIEEESLPADATVVGQTWKYLNKSGGPDKRFSNNRQIPICQYTEYAIESESGIHEVITTSKRRAMDNFSQFVRTIGNYQKNYSKQP